MSITKELILECGGHQKGIKNKFEYIDDNRKVDIATTHDIICKIKKRLEFYSKSTNKEIKKYLFFWNKWLKHDLVPDGIDIDFKSTTYQYFVKKNYELLEGGKLLSHNQALFLLLGLNAYALGKTIKKFPRLDCDEEPLHLAEMELWRTDQNQALLHSAFVVNGKITSEKLKELAESYNFFTSQYESSKNDNLANKPRQSTIDQQNRINEIAKEIMLKYPKSTRTSLSVDVAEALENSLKPATILRDYLKKYPNF